MEKMWDGVHTRGLIADDREINTDVLYRRPASDRGPSVRCYGADMGLSKLAARTTDSRTI